MEKAVWQVPRRAVVPRHDVRASTHDAVIHLRVMVVQLILTEYLGVQEDRDYHQENIPYDVSSA